MLRNILIMSDFSKQRELGKIYKMNRSKVVPFNIKEKEVNLCREKATTKTQKLEDRSRIRKASLLPVSKVDHQLIKTRKSEI